MTILAAGQTAAGAAEEMEAAVEVTATSPAATPASDPSGGSRPQTPGGLATVGGGLDGLTVGGLAAVGNRFALPGGSRPPDPLAGVATELAALSPLGFATRKDPGRGLAPPDPRCTGG